MKHLFVLIVAASAVLISFSVSDSRVRFVAPSSEMSVDVMPGSSPYLTKDNRGNTVLSWVRKTSDSTAVLCYSVLDGHDKTVQIPTSSNIHAHAENLPKVIFKPSGDVIAVWGVRNPSPENKYSGLIYYSQSFDEGKTWTAASRLVKDPKGFDQRYSDISLMKGGEVAIIWLDNRETNDQEGSAVYAAITDGKNGFATEVMVSEQACPCCRTSLFIDNNDNIHALYRGIINDSIRDMVHVVSNDGGKTVSTPERIFKDNWVLRGCPHTGPSMTENSTGLHFTWYTGGANKGSFYIRSENNGKSFEGRDSISNRGMHPQIAALPGDKLAIAWDEPAKRKDSFNKRIGIQVRNQHGISEITSYITNEGGFATYPVVKAVNDIELIVAYTVKKEYGEYVKWKRVKLT